MPQHVDIRTVLRKLKEQNFAVDRHRNPGRLVVTNPSDPGSRPVVIPSSVARVGARALLNARATLRRELGADV